MAVQGQVEEGLAQVRRLSLHDGTPGVTMCTLAEGYLASGRADKGLEAVSHGLARGQKSGQRGYEARLHHLQGELLLMQNVSNASQAGDCYRTAIETARRQGAKLFELSAMTSLARLLAQQGRRDEAHTMLGEIYGWFTEGFDTADLKDAKALLDELNQ